MLLNDITETSGLYYYLKMKDFERNQIQKNKKKYRELSHEEKNILHKLLKNEINDTFSFQRLQKHIAPKNLKINTYDDLFKFLSKVDLFKLLPHLKYIDSCEPCIFFEGNNSWISKNEEGHFRYFSKANKELTISLDLVDLLEIYYGCKTSEVISLLVQDFDITFMENVWFQKQNKKYLSNLTSIHSIDKKLKDYPQLFKLIKNHLKVLETMNVIGNINIKKQEFSYNDENIFFSSTRYIANFLQNMTVATINKIVNLFAVLGLIHKVNESNIPSQLLKESKLIANNRNLGNLISYYTIPNMEDVLDEAEMRAEKLFSNGTSYTNIDRKRIAYIFGEAFTNTIYVQEIQKNKKKKSEVPKNLGEKLKKTFFSLLEKHGYVTKKMIIQKKISKTVIKDRELELSKIWKSLLIEFNLKYIKPTYEMKQKYGLKSDEYIVIKSA